MGARQRVVWGGPLVPKSRMQMQVRALPGPPSLASYCERGMDSFSSLLMFERLAGGSNLDL